ncbi:uncharacterized protein C16orf52 homolog A [Lingula anatina]|uniref:Uncharacterized protein C16orf52 homolog A n=1 Tax=Lingula anatina TaxID=7574 RepID=A0A1S3IP70_LINAN|nr:uncharacterized protein C16orf52 homolog A [Lingula anatina]|eukprot:XP_013400007.1 uncharacterized protein C16orf52 homolog A [Lingula anatina]
MNKIVLISGILFGLADLFAIASLALPDWILTGAAGNMRLGLTLQCLTIHNRDEICVSPKLSIEWTTTFVLIIIGILCLTANVMCLMLSHWEDVLKKYAKWLAFFAMISFCTAGIVFPMGFYVDEIGGYPFQLPTQSQVGVSYVLFILSIFFTIISELLAEQICRPLPGAVF